MNYRPDFQLYFKLFFLRKTDSTVKLRTISHIKNFIFPQHLVGSLVCTPYL